MPAVVASVPMVLVANADLPIKSLQDVVTLTNSRVGGLSFGTIGVGSSQHLNMEYVKRTLGVEFTHMPYRGVNLGLNDVAGGKSTQCGHHRLDQIVHRQDGLDVVFGQEAEVDGHDGAKVLPQCSR